MRVCVFMNVSRHQGGAERRIARYCSYIAEHLDVDISMLLQGDEEHVDSFRRKYLRDGCRVLRSDSMSCTCSLVRSLRPDVFQFFDCSGSLVPVYAAAKRWSSVVVCDLASYLMTFDAFYSRAGRLICRTVLSNIDGISCLYPGRESVVRDMVSRWPLRLRRVPIVSSPPCSFTDLDMFRPANRRERVVVFSGRLTKEKNPMLFLRAVSQAAPVLRSKGYRVALCGTGPYFEAVREFVAAQALQDLVQTPGYVDMAEILPKSMIFVSVQSIENYPSQALMEAIACGNYIIATRVGDTGRIVRNGFGSLVPVSEDRLSEALLEAVIRLEDQRFAANVVDAARAFAEETFSIQRFCEYMTGFWSSVLEASRSGDQGKYGDR